MTDDLSINKDFCLSFPFIEKNIPWFTIIIACYNKQHVIAKTVSLLKKSGLNQKIILIDDRSTDDTLLEIKKISDIEIIENKENIGWGASNNVALNRVETEYVVFMDADFFVGTYGWLISWYLNNSYKNNVGESGELHYGDVLSFDKIYNHLLLQPWINNGSLFSKKVLNKDKDKDTFDHICGNYKIFKTDIIKKIGGFSNSNFAPCVEVEISFRAKANGYNIDSYRIPYRQTTCEEMTCDMINKKYEDMDDILEQQKKMYIKDNKLIGLLYNPINSFPNESMFYS
jgi:GT2 family glycosyltransferase